MKSQDVRWRRPALTALAVLLTVVAAVRCGPGSKPETQAPTTAAPDPKREAAVSACVDMLKLSLLDTAINNATIVPATGKIPEYCKIEGALENVILFEVSMPTTAWNGRFFYAGGGGYNGTVPDLNYALARGFASAGADGGHRGFHWDASAFYNNPQAQINDTYRAVHLVTVVAKQIVGSYYGRAAQHAYWSGCSNGSKMGLMEVQRYPDDFDGLVVGGLVIDRTYLQPMFVWTQQVLLGNPIQPYKIPAMEKATLAACDARDGLVDGLIDRPDKCKFDPKVLTCKGADGPDCLTPGQVTAWQKILDGPRNSAGTQLYVGYSPGHEGDYPAYITGAGHMHGYPSSNWMYSDSWLRWNVFGPSFDPVRQFDFDKSPAALVPYAKVQNADNTDLSGFKKHGGKLIMYNGWADHSTPPLRGIKYYNDVKEKNGPGTEDFVRLFMLPGNYHCSGGPGPNVFGRRGQEPVKYDADNDILTAAVQWVESGKAPERIIATKFVNDDPKQGVARTRPLCPYPQVAKYKGSGSIDEAANFVCATPTD